MAENAYNTLMEIGGLVTKEDYGYDGEGETCKFNRSRVAARVTGGVEIGQNETQMAQWLLQNGPISVGLNANAMQFYRGGVSHPFKFMCDPSGVDHGVLIVVLPEARCSTRSCPSSRTPGARAGASRATTAATAAAASTPSPAPPSWSRDYKLSKLYI